MRDAIDVREYGAFGSAEFARHGVVGNVVEAPPSTPNKASVAVRPGSVQAFLRAPNFASVIFRPTIELRFAGGGKWIATVRGFSTDPAGGELVLLKANHPRPSGLSVGTEVTLFPVDNVPIQSAIDATAGSDLDQRRPVYLSAGFYRCIDTLHVKVRPDKEEGVRGFHLFGDGVSLSVLAIPPGVKLDTLLDIVGARDSLFEGFVLGAWDTGYADKMIHLYPIKDGSNPQQIVTSNTFRDIYIGGTRVEGRCRVGFDIGNEDGTTLQCDGTRLYGCQVSGIRPSTFQQRIKPDSVPKYDPARRYNRGEYVIDHRMDVNLPPMCGASSTVNDPDRYEEIIHVCRLSAPTPSSPSADPTEATSRAEWTNTPWAASMTYDEGDTVSFGADSFDRGQTTQRDEFIQTYVCLKRNANKKPTEDGEETHWRLHPDCAYRFGSAGFGNNIAHMMEGCGWGRMRFGVFLDRCNCIIRSSMAGGAQVDVFSVGAHTSPISIEGLRLEGSKQFLVALGGCISVRDVEWHAEWLSRLPPADASVTPIAVAAGRWIRFDGPGTLRLDQVRCIAAPRREQVGLTIYRGPTCRHVIPTVYVKENGNGPAVCIATGVRSETPICAHQTRTPASWSAFDLGFQSFLIATDYQEFRRVDPGLPTDAFEFAALTPLLMARGGSDNGEYRMQILPIGAPGAGSCCVLPTPRTPLSPAGAVANIVAGPIVRGNPKRIAGNLVIHGVGFLGCVVKSGNTPVPTLSVTDERIEILGPVAAGRLRIEDSIGLYTFVSVPP